MKLIRGLHNLACHQADFAQGCVLTIGNFDGVHLGHRAILNQVHQLAAEKQLPSVVMVFEPLPIEYFSPKDAPVRLMNLREKLSAFKATAIDFVVVCRFDASFANLSAEAFVQTILHQGLNAKQVVVGDDFRFGKARQGDFSLLQQYGQRLGFDTLDLMTFQVDNDRVSSTRIRQALKRQDLKQASNLLGAPFSFQGRVIHGKKLGRQIGFRTLNLNPKRIQMPLEGVYSVCVSGLTETELPGIANIGIRPTVDGHRPSIEVHLFNWQKDVYGAHIGVKIVEFIRPEMKFDGIDALKAQIEKDVVVAQRHHGLL